MPNVGVRAASLAVESRKRLSPRILIAEVRIRRKAITAYGHDTRNDGRCGPDAAIRRRHGQHDGADQGHGRVARQRDHGGPGRRGLRGRQSEKWLPRAQARHQRGDHQPQDPEATRRQLLPRGPDRALLARGPRRGRRGLRDGDQRRVHQEGQARRPVHGHRPHERQPGVEDVLVAGRVGRRPAGTRPVGRQLPLRLARRHIHQVQGRRPRCSPPRS